MKNTFALLLFLLLGSQFSFAKVVVYPVSDDVRVKADYQVSVLSKDEKQWLPVAVYPVKVDEVAGGRHNVREVSYACFDFEGTVRVRVVALKPFKSCRIRPLSYGIEPERQGDTISFTLQRQCDISVEFDGDIFNNLHLSASHIMERPSKRELKSKRFLFFPKGVHRLPKDGLRLKSNTTVFVDGGARVAGTFIVDSVENVVIRGRGEVHPEHRGEGVAVRNSRNVLIEGITTTQVPVGGSRDVRIEGVKCFSSYGWGDGLNVFASQNVTYENCFCRTSDDCTTVYATRKGFKGSARNVSMLHSVLWADVAHPIFIGLHGDVERKDTIENILYDDIDILDQAERQIDYQGCMAINAGDENLVRNIVFRNIRIEDIRCGALLSLRVFENRKYCLAPGRGIENVLYENVSYNGAKAELSIVGGYNKERKVRDIRFKNLQINGKHIHDAMENKPRWWKTADMARFFVGSFVENLVFE